MTAGNMDFANTRCIDALKKITRVLAVIQSVDMEVGKIEQNATAGAFYEVVYEFDFV